MPRARLSMPLLLLALFAPLVVTAAGCTTYRESYTGLDSQRVWGAMVATAESPEYSDWFIIENEVAINEADARIDVYRRIRRDVRVPMGGTQRQERTLKHQIRLFEEDGHPLIEFYGRSGGVPANEQSESFRYFDQVWAAMGIDREAHFMQLEQQRAAEAAQPMMPILTPEEAQQVEEELNGAEEAAPGADEPEVDLDDVGG